MKYYDITFVSDKRVSSLTFNHAFIFYSIFNVYFLLLFLKRMPIGQLPRVPDPERGLKKNYNRRNS